VNLAGCQQQQRISTFVIKQKGLENVMFCVQFPAYVTWASFCETSLHRVHVGQVKPEDGGSVLVSTKHTWWWHNPED